MEWYKFIKCHDCLGTEFCWDAEYGKKGDGICSKCYGTGETDVFSRAMEGLASIPHKHRSKCSSCGGSKKCQSCRGRGVFKNKTPKPALWPLVKEISERSPKAEKQSRRSRETKSQDDDYSSSYTYKPPIPKWKLILRSLIRSVGWLILGGIVAFPLDFVLRIVVDITTDYPQNEPHWALVIPKILPWLSAGIGFFLNYQFPDEGS